MKSPTNKWGLPQTAVDALSKIFAENPAIKSVIIYGSRAKGTYKNGSDIDLTIVSPELNLSDLMTIETEIDDLLLPYKIDLSLHSQIDNPALLDQIDRVGQTFFTR